MGLVGFSFGAFNDLLPDRKRQRRVGSDCLVVDHSPAVAFGCLFGVDEKKRELYLVEKEVDNPTAIRNRLQLVRDNYAEVKVLLNAFVLEYNSRLELIKEKMYKELKQ